MKDLHYRLLHYSTKTNDCMHKCSNDNNSNCDHCEITEENLHVFTKCSKIKENLDTLPINTYKINRKNLQSATILTRAKR